MSAPVRLLHLRATDRAIVIALALPDGLRLVRVEAADAAELSVLAEADRSKVIGALLSLRRGSQGAEHGP